MAKTIPVELSPTNFEQLQSMLDRAGEAIADQLADALEHGEEDDIGATKDAARDYVEVCAAVMCNGEYAFVFDQIISEKEGAQ